LNDTKTSMVPLASVSIEIFYLILLAQQNQNTQQATPLYVQQQQYINQFTQQAANVRAVGPQNIPPPLGLFT